jgi:pimeloyl-ACP methyl ester carboxylesterase
MNTTPPESATTRKTRSASMAAAGWRERTITVGRLRFHIVEAGEQGDPVLLLLHGFPEFWFAWRDYINVFASLGYHVIAPDQRGYNLSERPRGVGSYVARKLAADAVGILDSVGAMQATVIGHDWGGHVAWTMAELHPHRLNKLVILNAAHPRVMARNVLFNPRQILKSWYGLFFQLPLLPELFLSLGNYALLRRGLRRRHGPQMTDAETRRYVVAWSQPRALTTMLNWYRALLRSLPLGKGPRIRVPTLLLWGAHDQFLVPRMAQQSIALCDRGQLHWFEHGSHWLHHEEVKAVRERISAFLGE